MSAMTDQTSAALADRRDPVKVRRTQDLTWPEARMVAAGLRDAEAQR